MMQAFVGFLFFVSLICLIVGLIKPSLFSRIFKRTMSRKSVGLIFGISTLTLFVMIGLTAPNLPKDNSAPAVSKSASEATPTENVAATSPKVEEQKPEAPQLTDQQKLEVVLKNNVAQATGTTKVSYRGIEVQNADPDRPAGTKMFTVSVNITDFYNKDSLIRNTGKLSSSLFQSVYGANMNAYDVIVWYYGKTTDRYGTQKDDIILSYAIDKKTYDKINWSNFDQTKLCDFLKQEDQFNGNNFNTACNTLVNIQ